ncbi:MAG TPA: DegT/DnrJ/EryC1/StrS family aminotransferase [Candidatus Polarisedimenticolia bacterium]|nr:DegT/DnrJ/EryC1/StrS family aminotransferase [Candidatus Polarisedimenticolia bacterium]
MNVPFLDLKRQHASIAPEVERAVQGVLESQRFILGPEVGLLEQEIATLCATAHGVGVASGTDALILALLALGVGPGDEVITSPFSFFASASSITRVGARPVFADIDPLDYNIDPDAVRRAVTPRTRAVIAVHLFGQCADVDRIRRAATEAPEGPDRRIAIVEDAAQAIGSSRSGRPAGSIGDAGCFSFYPTKNLGGAGDGGMLVTNDAALAERVRRLRAHGDAGRYDHREIGLNSRLDTLQAAVLLVKARHLPLWTELRRQRASIYDRELAGVGGLTPPLQHSDCIHTYHQYVVRTPRRGDLARFLGEAGIGTAVYYPIPLHRQRCFASLGHGEGDFPASESAAREVLALPIFPELTDSEQSRVVDVIRTFFAKG